MADSISIYRALSLPQGWVRAVTPTVVYQDRAYAYELIFEPVGQNSFPIDARQLPLQIPQLEGHYGEIGAYITAFTAISRVPSSLGSLICRYLGVQMSLVFFQELLDRYHLLQLEDETIDLANHSEESDEDIPLDGVAAFQDRYDVMSEGYHPLGFPISPYQSVPMLETPLGTFFLSNNAAEQLIKVVQPGDSVFVTIDIFSLASFKLLR
jgi:hypothetical protein